MSISPSTIQKPQNVNYEEQLEYLEKLQQENEALKSKTEGPDAQDSSEMGEMPDIDFSQLNIPINPIFDDNFDGMGPLMNIGKLVIGPTAVKMRAIGPSMGILGAFIGMTNNDLVPGFISLGITAASAFLLKNQIKNIDFRLKEHKSALGWLASKTMMVAKIGLTAYSVASGIGMLSSAYGAYRAIGLLTTATSIGGGLYSLYSSASQPAEASEKSSRAYSMLKNITKVGAIGYGTIAGLGTVLGLGNLPGIAKAASYATSLTNYAPVAFGAQLLEGLTGFVAQKPIELVLALGLTLGMQLIHWNIVGNAFTNLNNELEKINKSNKYGPTLEKLQAIGQEEYHDIITRETGMEFEKIKDVFEPLKSRDPYFPENAAKPVIARLILLNQEVYGPNGAMQKYAELVKTNNLQSANEFFKKEVRQKLMTIVYLKHCIVSPTRPQFGNIIEGAGGSQEYFSLVSHLVGMPIKLPLQEIDPGKVQEEAHLILMKENEIQQQYYIYKMMHEKELLKQKAEEASAG